MKTIKIVLALLVIACNMYVDYENEYYMLIRGVGALVFVVVGLISNESKKRTLAGVLVGLGLVFHPYISQVVEVVLGSVLWYVVIIAITIWLIVLMIRDR